MRCPYTSTIVCVALLAHLPGCIPAGPRPPEGWSTLAVESPADLFSDDEHHSSLFQLLMTRMAEQPEAIDYSMELMLVSRNIERVGDMATNIAEEVVYLVEGTTIKHGAEKKG